MRLSRRSFYKCYLVFLCIIMMLSGICYGAGPDDPVSTSEKNNVTSNRASQSASFSQAEQVSQPIQSEEHAYKLGEELDTTKIKVRLNREPCTWVSWCYAIINELKSKEDNDAFDRAINEIGDINRIFYATRDYEKYGAKEQRIRCLLSACRRYSHDIQELKETLQSKLEEYFPNRFEVTIIESSLEKKFDPLYYIDIQAGGDNISTSRVEMFEGEKVDIKLPFDCHQRVGWIYDISDNIMSEEGVLADVLEMSRFILPQGKVDTALKSANTSRACYYDFISKIYNRITFHENVNKSKESSMEIMKGLFEHFYPGRFEWVLSDSA